MDSVAVVAWKLFVTAESYFAAAAASKVATRVAEPLAVAIAAAESSTTDLSAAEAANPDVAAFVHPVYPTVVAKIVALA